MKQKVVHLGQHSTIEDALESWPKEIKEFYRIGRPKRAEKLRSKLNKLEELTKGED